VLGIGRAIVLVAVVGAIALAAGVAVLRMFTMYLDREISGSELLVWLFVYLAAFSMAFAAWGTPLFFPIVLLCLALAVAYPLGTYLVEIHGRWRLRNEDIAAYARAAAENPNNPYPLKRLGDIFFESRDYEIAVKYYKQYLARFKDPQIVRRMERAQEYMRQSPAETRICPLCHAANPKGVSHCIECGELLPGIQEFLEPFRGRKGISILLWTAGVTMAIGLGLVVVQVLTARFAPLLAYILLPLMFLLAITALFVYIYVRIST